MSREADFSQFEKFAQSWQDVNKGFETFLKQFLLEMALRAIVQMKKNTPVITGAMRAMWGIGSQNIVVRTATGTGLIEVDPERSQVADIDVVGDTVEVVIWNGMDYASFVEYGARNRDGSWREGIFIMTVAIDQIQRQIPARFDKALKAYLASKGAV